MPAPEVLGEGLGGQFGLKKNLDPLISRAAYRPPTKTGNAGTAWLAVDELATTLARRGDFGGAVATYEEAIGSADGPANAAYFVYQLRQLLFSSPIRARRLADASVLIGSGELKAAEAVVAGWCAEEEASRRGPDRYQLNDRWPFIQLIRIQDTRGDLSGAAATLTRYLDLEPHAASDELVRMLEEGLANAEDTQGQRQAIYPWGGRSDPLPEVLRNNGQFRDAGVFFRPLPKPAAGGIRFVLIGGRMCYVDRRGEHSCSSEDPLDGPEALRLAEDTSRVLTLTQDWTWTEMAVTLCHRLLGAAQRCGDPTAWALAAEFRNGSFRQTIKALGSRPPTKLKPDDFAVRKPPRGTWLYHHYPASFVLHQLSREPLYRLAGDAPRVALWRWPDRSDLMLRAWCDTLAAASPSPMTVVLADTPMLRDFARRYVRREPMHRIDRTYVENALHFAGEDVPDGLRPRPGQTPPSRACYLRVRPSLVVDSDGTELDGDLLTVALDYLETHYQLRISPFDALRDPLLSGLLTGRVDKLRHARAADSAWRPDELRQIAELREVYEQYRAGQNPELDLYAVHAPVRYES